MYIRRTHRMLLGIAIAIALAAGVYAWRGPAVLDEAQDAAHALVKKASGPPPPTAQERVRSQSRHAADGKAPVDASLAPLAQPRKCLKDGKVIYTDEPCPAGSHEQPVPENLSVIPSGK